MFLESDHQYKPYSVASIDIIGKKIFTLLLQKRSLKILISLQVKSCEDPN